MEGDWIMSTTWTGLNWFSTKSNADDGDDTNEVGTGKVNTEIYTRLNFYDSDVKKVFIDWDDGPDQTSVNGIYQWTSLESPTGSVVLSHTYTATGTFAPVIRSVNSRGFISKYYGSSSTNNDVDPYEQVIRISPVRISDETPLAISKIENKTVRSGIDNSPFNDGPKSLFIGVPPLLTQAELTEIGEPKLEVKVIRQIISGTSLTNYTAGGYKEIGTYNVTISLSGGTVSSSSDSGLYRTRRADRYPNRRINPLNEAVHQILEVKYLNPKVSGATYNIEKAVNKLKIFICASGSSPSTWGNISNLQEYGDDAAVAETQVFFPITYVSAGDPIKKSDDSRRTVRLDWTQSRAAGSNVDISNYLYDTGKAPFQVNNMWNVSGTQYPNKYALSSSNFTTNLSGNNSSLTTQYTYMPRPDGLMMGMFASPGLSGTFVTMPWYILCNDVNTDLFNYSAGNNNSSWGRNQQDTWGPQGASDKLRPYYAVGDQFLVDDYDRFQDIYHLTRVQTKAKSGERSKLEYFDILRVTPSRYAYSGSDQGTNIEMTDAQGRGRSAIITSGAIQNSLSAEYVHYRPNYTSSGTAGLLSDWITGDNTSGGYRIGPTTESDNSEYLLLFLDRPFNKIHFNISPFLSGGNASGTVALDNDLVDRFNNPIQVQASYLRVTNSGTFTQSADLVPLKIKDTTKYERNVRDNDNSTVLTRTSSLAKSGYITFDTPSDWSKTTYADLAGNLGGMMADSYDDKEPSYAIPWTGTVIRIVGENGTTSVNQDVVWGALLSGSGVSRNSELLNISSSTIGANKYIFTTNTTNALFSWVSSGTGVNGWYPDGNQYGIDSTHPGSSLPQGIMYVRGGQQTSQMTSGSIWNGYVMPVNIYDAVPGFLKYDLNQYGNIGDGGSNYRWMFDNASVGSGTSIARNISQTWENKYVLQLKIKGGYNRFPNTSGSNSDKYTQLGAEVHNITPADNAYSQIVKQVDNSAYNLSHLKITSNLSMNRAGNYYRAMSKGGRVYIVKLGETISNITFNGKGMGDESQFKYSNPNTLYGDLYQLRNLQKDNVRTYWDETQKDGTFVRFFGIITAVNETHSVKGPMAPRPYTANMTVEEILLLNASGSLISDLESLGGIKDERDFF
jgi:hypothetical protein